MKRRLTEEWIRQAPLRKKKPRLEIFDTGCAALQLRIGARNKVWFVWYRDAAGKNVPYWLGKYQYPQEAFDPKQPPSGSLAWARLEAPRIKAQAENARRGVEGAEDPRDDRRRRLAEREAHEPRRRTLNKWFYPPADCRKADQQNYYTTVAKHSARKSAASVNRTLELYLIAPLGERRLDTIRREDLEGIVNKKIGEGHEVMANRLRTYIRHFFRWACAKAEIENPALHLEKETGTEQPRDRILNEREIAAFWAACESMTPPFGDLARFLLLTGARRGEAALSEWSEFNLDNAEWRSPATRQKNNKANLVPLTEPVLDIVRAQSSRAKFVFATPTGKPLSNWSRSIATLNKKMQEILGSQVNLERVTIHDLRRTLRSGLDDLGIRHVVAEAIMNHEIGSAATRAYTHSEMIEHKREALEAWTHHVVRLVETENF